MSSHISMKKIWNDDDVTELTIKVCDGKSTFANDVYIGFNKLETLIQDLNIFRKQVYGGLYNVKFGEFGPEYANGGFHARLHFYQPGKLVISTYQQSDFEDFSMNKVASEARMFLKTEPILLDNFITELKALNLATSDEATLVCI